MVFAWESPGETSSLCDAWVRRSHNSLFWLQNLWIFENLV